jgi:hypothetical protein
MRRLSTKVCAVLHVFIQAPASVTIWWNSSFDYTAKRARQATSPLIIGAAKTAKTNPRHAGSSPAYSPPWRQPHHDMDFHADQVQGFRHSGGPRPEAIYISTGRTRPSNAIFFS